MASLSTGARLRASFATAALTAATLLGTAATTAPAAHAEGSSSSTWNAKAQRILSVASNQRGKPYRYGAAGPSAYDCSGLILYVYRNSISRSLSHNAAAQYRASKHIRRTSLRVGDLVFVRSGGGISHVGIYAGDGYWWHAPHTGAHVERVKMYSASFVYGTFTH
jgi:cell wall-associated NlpC family hydrolase